MGIVTKSRKLLPAEGLMWGALIGCWKRDNCEVAKQQAEYTWQVSLGYERAIPERGS